MSRPPATYNELQRTDVAMDDFEGFLKDGNGGEESLCIATRAVLLTHRPSVGHSTSRLRQTVLLGLRCGFQSEVRSGHYPVDPSEAITFIARLEHWVQ
jgi:hypothetical protein